MIKIDNVQVWGFEGAIRGMRNPKNSWDKSDSTFDKETGKIKIGKEDLSLMTKLYNTGTEHRKFLRMIHVQMDITAPHYFWHDFDTYKIGVSKNSCSKMHKLLSRPFKVDDFSTEYLDDASCLEHPSKSFINYKYMNGIVDRLNFLRCLYYSDDYKEDPKKQKLLWYSIMQLLPMSYNQKATVDMNYENVCTIIKQREGHKLEEFRDLCDLLLKLPAVEKLMRSERKGK